MIWTNHVRSARVAIAALGALAFTAGAPATAEPAQGAVASKKPPVLVELFTSQGCASCPKANAFLGQLSHEPNLITLTYAVGYWDYLGWRDTLAKPEFTDRQKSFAARFKHGVYTPQMIVNGEAHTSGLKAKELRTLLESAETPHGAKLHAKRSPDDVAKAKIDLGGKAPEDAADIWLAQVNPGPLYVDVKNGENAGAKVPHFNVVTRLTKLGAWTGGEKHMVVDCALSCAVIVQTAEGGPVLAARMVWPQGVTPPAAPPAGPAVAAGN
jgi:hypothetical protein